MENLALNISYRKCSYEELEPSDRKIVDAAKDATRRSYSPYSHFSVGAALLLEGGEIVTGCNQENAAYPSGLCAERTALFSAGSAFPDKAVEVLAIAAYTDGAFTGIPVTPCGSCRQVMAETESRHGNHIRIILYGTDFCLVFDKGVADILPFCFGAGQLTGK